MNKGALGLEDKFEEGKYIGMTVDEVISKDRKALLSLSREGYDFKEEVFAKARFKRQKRDENVVLEIVSKPKFNDNKVYAKDVKSVKKIIEELSTVDKPFHEENSDEEDKMETIYENE